MSPLGWILGLLAAILAIAALPFACRVLMRSLVDHWRNAPAGGSAFNPLQEFLQPQIRHVVEVHEHRLVEDGEGAPRVPGQRKSPDEEDSMRE